MPVAILARPTARHPSTDRRPPRASRYEVGAVRAAGAVLLVALATLGGMACAGAEAGAGSETVRRDSAGIEIVESPAPAWGEDEGWRLADAPNLDIGRLEGAPEEQLFRVTGAALLPDGRTAIANAGTHEVRFYGPDGAYLSAVGREGDGPGEFRFLFNLALLGGDTVRVWDGSARRLTDLSATAGFLTATRLPDPPEGRFTSYVGTLADDRVVVSMQPEPDFEALEDGKLMQPDDMVYRVYSAEGDPGPELGKFPQGERITRSHSENGVLQSISIITPPFRNGTEVAVTPAGLVAALPDRFELHYLDADTGLTRIVRYGDELRPVTEARIEEWVNRAPPERRADQRAWIEGVPMPEYVPTVQELLVDLEGNAWIRRYSDDREAPSTWTVVASGGEWLGTVEMPPRFRPLDIGEDYVLGEWTDELDIEHIRRFELGK